MALKGKITKAEMESLAEVIRKEYKPLLKDGQPVKDSSGNELYILDAPDMEHREDTQALKNALESERAQNTTRQQKITEHESSLTKLAADLESARKNNKGEAEITAIKDQMKTENEKLVKAVESQRDTYRNELDRVVRIDAARAAITAPADGSKRTKGSADLLLPHLLDRTKFEEIKDSSGNPTGKFKVVVVNERGEPRIGDSQGNPMTIDQLLDEMHADNRFARAFEPVGGSGSGADNNNSGGGGTLTIKRSDQTALNDNIEKIASGEITVVDG